MELTREQIKRLRAEGHRKKLKPVVIVGQNGLGENLHAEIESALQRHELIKLRLPGLPRNDKRELWQLICSRHDAELVQAIGNVIVIFRRNADTNRYAALID